MHACIYTLLYNVTTHVGPSLPSRIRILHSPLSLSTRLQAATGMNGGGGGTGASMFGATARHNDLRDDLYVMLDGKYMRD